MSTRVRVVKKSKRNVLVRVDDNVRTKEQHQHNREIVGVVKNWIKEFKLRSVSTPPPSPATE